MALKKSQSAPPAGSKKNGEIIRKFRIRRTLNLLSTLIIFGAAFFAFWYSNNRSSIPEGTRSIYVIVICSLSLGALIFSLFNWRCPSCGKHLGGGIDPAACRKCGFRFR